MINTKVMLGVVAAVVAVGAAVAVKGSTAAPAPSSAAMPAALPSDQSTAQSVACSSFNPNQNFFSYVGVRECHHTGLTGASATLTLPDHPPALDPRNPSGHSLAELALTEPSSQPGPCGDFRGNALEVGWEVAQDDPKKIKLFVFHTSGSQNASSGYSVDWQPVVGAHPQPGEDISKLSPMRLSVSYTAYPVDTDGGWNIAVNNTKIGYYPNNSFGAKGFHPSETRWYGEVSSSTGGINGVFNGAAQAINTISGFFSQDVKLCSPHPEPRSADMTCTQMGNGSPTVNAASFSNLKTEGGSYSGQRQIYTTDPATYGSDKYKGSNGGDEVFVGDSFKFGGPGTCPPPKRVVLPAPVKTKPKPVVRPKPKPSVTSNSDGPDQSGSQEQSGQQSHEPSQESSSCGNGMVRVGPETDTSSGCAPVGSQNNESEKNDSPTTPANGGGVQDQVCPPVCGNNGGGDVSSNRGGL